MHRNPYALDLALARCYGWALATVYMAWAFVWVTSTGPDVLASHRLGITIILVMTGLVQGYTEDRLTKEFTAYEDKRFDQLTQAKITEAEIDAFLKKP